MLRNKQDCESRSIHVSSLSLHKGEGLVVKKNKTLGLQKEKERNTRLARIFGRSRKCQSEQENKTYIVKIVISTPVLLFPYSFIDCDAGEAGFHSRPSIVYP